MEVTFPNGAEDLAYMSDNGGGYRTPNRSMVDLEELRLVYGVEQAWFDTLKPYIAALPSGSKININWATVEILQSISDKISAMDAEDIITRRTEAAFESLEEVGQHTAFKDKAIDLGQIQVSSDYFLLQTAVQIAHVQRLWQSLLYKTPQEVVQVILRTREFN